VQVILRRRGLAPSYVPPISVILARDKATYINGLTAYREGRVEAWLEVFAVAAARAARLARVYLLKVSELQEEWRTMVQQSARIRSDAAVWKLIDALPALPIVTVATAVAKIDRTKPAVNQAIEQLVAAHVLIPSHGAKRNRAWEGWGLFDLLSRLEAGEGLEHESEDERTPDNSEPYPVAEYVASPYESGAITRLPFTDSIYRLGPGSWLVPLGEAPDLTARLAVALPSVLPMGGTGSTQLVTRLRGQRREELLVRLLNASPVTTWLRSLRSTWHWTEDVDWITVGSGSPEFTELWFAPFGLEKHRPAFAARCGFATGVSDDLNVTGAPTVQAAIDVMCNSAESQGDHQAVVAGTESGSSPVAAAFSLSEVADILRSLFGFVEVAHKAAIELLPPPQPLTARLGEWITTSGGTADQVIDLSGLRRIPRSTGFGQAADAFRMELQGGTRLTNHQVREFVSNLLYEALERGGYRELDEAIDRLRSTTSG
jgi:hypothetical protein